jgi:hypothetical protein
MELPGELRIGTLLALALFGACKPSRIEAAGGSGRGSGGSGGAASGDAGFTFTVSDGAAGEGGRVSTLAPDNNKCLEESHVAQAVPVDRLLLVDSSGSRSRHPPTRPSTSAG